MKSLSFGLSICLSLAFAVSTASAQGGAPGLVTVLDVAKVFEKHPVFNAKMEALKNEVQEFQKDVRGKVTKLAEKRQSLTREFTIGTPKFKEAEESLAREEADLKVKTGQTEREYMNKEAKLYYETYLEVQSIVANFARSNNISLVLRFDSTDIDQTNRASVSNGVNRFIVYQEKLDLTGLIITEVEKKAQQAGIQGAAPR